MIATTISSLASIIAASTQVNATKVFTAYPAVLNDVDLPAVIIVPGPAEWAQQALGPSLRRQIRTYHVHVYCKAVAQGAGIDEGAQTVLGPLNALGNVLLNNITLNNTVDEVMQNFTDSGLRGDLMYAGVAYHGCTYEIRIKEKTSTALS